MHMSFTPDLVVDSLHEIAGDRESEAFAATGLGQDKSIDADHASVRVNQRSAAVTGIDGRVGLNISHEVVGMELACCGADNSHTDRALQAQRVSESHHQLALAEPLGVAQRQVRQTSLFDSQYGDVDLAIHSYQLRLEKPGSRLIAAGRREADLDEPGAAHHVSVG